jgi:hypothetical protein
MTRIPPILLLSQAFAILLALALGFAGLVMAWTYFLESGAGRRPAFNLKEL